MELFNNDVISVQKIIDDTEKMNSFGSRLTGTNGQNNFCKWIKQQLAEKNFEILSKEYTFQKWEATSSSIVIDGEIYPTSSEFPYSGLTEKNGITAKLQQVNNNTLSFGLANGKIGVLEMTDLSGITSKIAFQKRNSLPKDLEIDAEYHGPVATTFVKTLLTFWSTHISGMKGLICIWRGMSDAMVDGQYLNFILGYLGVPIVWVTSEVGDKILEKTRQNREATLTLLGSYKKAKTESFACVIKGIEPTKESILINTHTDGLNFCEENGALGLLALIDYFTKHPTRRNLVFAFVTGHFRLPIFGVGADQATSKFLKDFPALWRGRPIDRYKAVAGCSIEHLGCQEWKDLDGVYQMTNPIDKEVVYTGNEVMDKIYYEACQDRTLLRTITLHGHNFLHFGEGQPLFNKRIPEIALVTSPDYLCSFDKSGKNHMDKFYPELAKEQIETFIRCIILLDSKTKKEIGNCQPYSLGLGKLI